MLADGAVRGGDSRTALVGAGSMDCADAGLRWRTDPTRLASDCDPLADECRRQ